MHKYPEIEHILYTGYSICSQRYQTLHNPPWLRFFLPHRLRAFQKVEQSPFWNYIIQAVAGKSFKFMVRL